MRETVLIILAAVVALIVVVVLLGMRYLRADEDDDFDDDVHAEHGGLSGRVERPHHDRDRARVHAEMRDPRGQRPGSDRALAGRGAGRGESGWTDSGRGNTGRGDSGRGESGRGGHGRSESGRAAAGRGGWPDADGRDDRRSREPLPNREPGRPGSRRERDEYDRDSLDVSLARGDRSGRSGIGPGTDRDHDRDGASPRDLASRNGRDGRDRRDGHDSRDARDSREIRDGRAGRDLDDRIRDGRGSGGRGSGSRGSESRGSESRGSESRGLDGRDRSDLGWDSRAGDSRAGDSRAGDSRAGSVSRAASARDAAPGRDDRDRRSATRPNARPEGRRGADRDDSLPSVRPRPARGKRDSDGDDWPSNEWDELSDVDYWAEVASDKPLTSTTQPGSRIRPEREPRGKDADTGSHRSDRRSADRLAADRPAADRPAADRPASDRPASDRPAAERPASDWDPTRSGTGRPARQPDYLDTGSRRAAPPASDPLPALPAARSGPISGPLPEVVIDDDDPLTSPSFPRIETDDSRSYRRSRSASPTSPGTPFRSGDPYARGGEQLSGEHPLPAADPYRAPVPTGSYQVPVSSGSATGSYPVPVGQDSYQASPVYPADAGYQAQGGTASYLMPPVQPVAGYHGDPYSLPGTSLPAPSLPAGTGGAYPADSAIAHYQPGGSYAAPSGAVLSGEPGLDPADQTVNYQHGYGRDSGQHARPETSYRHSGDYPLAGYGGDGPPGFGAPEPGGHPSGPFPAYQGSAPYGTSLPSGQYQATPPAGQPAAPYQAYEPAGYPEPDSYSSADPYAMDPYGYSGYSNGH